jgi:GNAT superfamily N-acetyltransferase
MFLKTQPHDEIYSEFIDIYSARQDFDEIKSILLLNHTHRVFFYHERILLVISCYTINPPSMNVLGVLALHQGCGLGSFMIDYLKEEARRLNLDTILLTPENNTTDFYIKNGFDRYLGGKLIYRISKIFPYENL